MKKNRRFFLLTLMGALLLSCMGCSSDDDANPFVGTWKIVGVEDETGVSDYGYGNECFRFYPDGRFANVNYYVGGRFYETSESEFDIRYQFTGQELTIDDLRYGIMHYSYVFSDFYKTLRITLRKVDYYVDFFTKPEEPLMGKTLILKKQL